MRIALVSTPFVSVPPKGYGGTELVVAELAIALRDLGHEVVVYATGDSELPGIEIRSYFSTAQWPPSPEIDRAHARFAVHDLNQDPLPFDVVHVHSVAAAAQSHRMPAPVVATLHHDHDPELSGCYAPGSTLVAISRAQARRETARVSAVIHHGLNPERFQPLPDQGYLLFLGRYDREKGVAQAIEVACDSGLPLVLAGATHQKKFYQQDLLPLIEKHNILDVGPVGGARKVALIARARALLFPIQWEEPFGLVMIEALLSGVPVFANARGSVPEIIQDGLDGVICDDPSEMVAAARVSEKFFDRVAIRARAQERWSAARMASEYLRVYEGVAEREVTPWQPEQLLGS